MQAPNPNGSSVKLAGTLFVGFWLAGVAWFFVLLGVAVVMGEELIDDSEAFVIPAGIIGLPFFLSIWAVLDGRAPHWRLLIVAMPMGGMACFTQWFSNSKWFVSELNFLCVTAFIFTLAQGSALLVIRAAGLKLQEVESPNSERRDGEDADNPEPSKPVAQSAPRSRVQFSIGNILSWTAATAVLLSFVSTVNIFSADHSSQGAFSNTIWQQFAIAVVFGVATLSIVWTMLSTRAAGERCGALASAILVSALCMVAIAEASGASRYTADIFIMSSLTASTLFVGVLPVSLAGFRLVRIVPEE